MAKQRLTTKGKPRTLLKGESQLPDGRFMFRYTDVYGKRRKIYSWQLEKGDYVPVGKKKTKPLRELEEEILDIKKKGIDGFASKKATLNERWEYYLTTKALKPSTKSNYEYLWDTHIRNNLGCLKLLEIEETNKTRERKIPSFIQISDDVTENVDYRNAALYLIKNKKEKHKEKKC